MSVGATCDRCGSDLAGGSFLVNGKDAAYTVCTRCSLGALDLIDQWISAHADGKELIFAHSMGGRARARGQMSQRGSDGPAGDLA